MGRNLNNEAEIRELLRSEERWYTVPELQKMFSVTAPTVYRWFDDGLEKARIGTTIRIAESKLVQFMARTGIQLDEKHLEIFENDEDITLVRQANDKELSRPELAFKICSEWIDRAESSLRFVNSIQPSDWFTAEAIKYLCKQRELKTEKQNLEIERIVVGKRENIKEFSYYFFIWTQLELGISILFKTMSTKAPIEDFALIDAGKCAYVCDVDRSTKEITKVRLLTRDHSENKRDIEEHIREYDDLRRESIPIQEIKEFGEATIKHKHLLDYIRELFNCGLLTLEKDLFNK